MKESILIIANGPSVLNHKIGKKIDQFPVIARINNYRIEGFEDYIGSKTNIWLNGNNQGLNKRDSLPKEVIVLIPPVILNQKGESIHKLIHKRLNINQKKYGLVSYEKMLQFEQMCKPTRLTTGMNSICWAMDIYDEVFIHGFDFFQNSKGHYFDGKIIDFFLKIGLKKKGKKHDLAKERNFFISLIKHGKIKKLVE